MQPKMPKFMLVLLSVFFLFSVILMCKALFDTNSRIQRSSHYEPVAIAGEYRLNNDPAYQPFTDPAIFDVSTPTTVYLRGHFTKAIEKNQTLVMRINNLRVQLFVNGEKVFSFGEEGTFPDFIRSAGSVFTSFVSNGISEDDIVELTLTNIYVNSMPTAFSDFFDFMVVGSEYEAYTDLIGYHLLDPVISVLSLIIGVIMLAASIYARRINSDKTSHYDYLAGFIIASGIWFLSGSPIISLLIPYPAFNEIIYTLSIFFMAVLFLLYVLAFVKSKLRRMLLLLVGILVITMIASIVIQYFGLIDLYALLTYHLLIILVISIIFTSCLLYELIRLHSSMARLAMSSLLILSLGAMADMLNYFFDFYLFSIGYKIAFLAFAVLQLIRLLNFLEENVIKMRKYAQMENELLQSRISVMLSQIKPHFLYNTLNAISALCLTDPSTAEEAVSALSSYLRGNIQALETQAPVPFEQELNHIQNYVSIEKMRFGDRLHFVCDIGYSDFSVPTLSLQTLVENAIRHGVSQRPEGGTVIIKTEFQDGYAVIRIIDDGLGFDQISQSEDKCGIGLRNARMRLQYMVDAELTVKSEPSQGTVVTIRIPVGQEGRK